MRHEKTTSSIVLSLLEWFSKNARDLPWRRTHDPYAIHVSEIMLQQTQVKTVIPFWERWLRELPTIESAAKASSDKLHKLWEGLGYYTRVRNLQKAAQVIVERHGGKFPKQFDEVLALPGIGRYTAGAICSIAFNQPTPILDGNVMRVLTRVFGIAENPKDKAANQKLWALAEELVVKAREISLPRSSRCESAPFEIRENELEPTHVGCYRVHGKEGQPSKVKHSQSLLTSAPTIGNCSALNQSLMELGALICTPRHAQCLICPVQKLCVAFRTGRVEELPNLGERTQATARRFVAFVLEQDGKFLVRQRPAGVVNAHLWEFPNVEVAPRDDIGVAVKHFPEFEGVKWMPLVTVKHSITRYRITLEAVMGKMGTRPNLGLAKTRPSDAGAVWKTAGQMHTLAFTAAHKKILARIQHGLSSR